MLLAINNSDRGFHPRWIKYCKNNNITFKLVNCYSNDIINQLKDCDAFLWHHSHIDYRDKIFAKQLLYSLQMAGMKVFPNFNTTWHFDDKVGQKYLLEAIGAPIVPSHVFYSKTEALQWLESTQFPIVNKLSGGAGSTNVRMVSSKKEAIIIINKSFGKGFKQYNAWKSFKERWRKFLLNKAGFEDALKGLIRFVHPTPFNKMSANEKGYVYFQTFIPNNNFDIRVVVVADKAFALKRMNRKNDFRASGGGEIIYSKDTIDEKCISIAFDVNDRIKSQSIAFDFIFDKTNSPLIIEISFGYDVPAYDFCEGYWTKDLQWHEGSHFDFCGWMIESIIE